MTLVGATAVPKIIEQSNGLNGTICSNREQSTQPEIQLLTDNDIKVLSRFCLPIWSQTFGHLALGQVFDWQNLSQALDSNR